MNVFETAKLLVPVSIAAIEEYGLKANVIEHEVSQRLLELNKIHNFAGNCPVQIQLDNFRYLTLSLRTLFPLHSYTSLARTFVWMYRAGRAHGLASDYFKYALSELRAAVMLHLSPANAQELDCIYRWLAVHHADFIRLAEAPDYYVFPKDRGSKNSKNIALQLIHGEYRECAAACEHYLSSNQDLASLYVDLLQAGMYEVGRLWEAGHITVAQEHLATAIVSRVMLECFLRARKQEPVNLKAVIAAAPGEQHEIGARMVADLLEQQGWNVHYLGANVPRQVLLAYLKSNPPHLVGLSAVMPFNLISVRNIIAEIRSDASIAGIKIMAGGAAFKHEEGLWRQIGVDAYAADGRMAMQVAQAWREEKRRQ